MEAIGSYSSTAAKNVPTHVQLLSMIIVTSTWFILAQRKPWQFAFSRSRLVCSKFSFWHPGIHFWCSHAWADPRVLKISQQFGFRSTTIQTPANWTRWSAEAERKLSLSKLYNLIYCILIWSRNWSREENKRYAGKRTSVHGSAAEYREPEVTTAALKLSHPLFQSSEEKDLFQWGTSVRTTLI